MTTTEFSRDRWQQLADAHTERWRPYLDPALHRRVRGEKHPVADFLFDYYPIRLSHLRRWHPGAGVVLLDSADSPRASWKWYTPASGRGSRVDHHGFVAKNQHTLEYIAKLLGATLSRPGQFNCFGMHEWAMVYQLRPGQQRHENLPLRLSHERADQVVDEHQLRCTHIDAYRFFTDPAAAKNSHQLSRENQPQFEQPGCLHANMDLYKWALKLGPLVPGELLFDTFELAFEIRQLDMQASPYDVSTFDMPAVKVETPSGKQHYVQAQRGFTQRANRLRQRLLQVINFVISESALH